MSSSLLVGSKRGWSSASEDASVTTTDDTVSAFYGGALRHSSFGLKKARPTEEACNHEVQQSAQQFFFVWDHHATKLQASLPAYAGQLQQHLQPADSSTAHALTALSGLTAAASCDVLQQADQMDCDSRAAPGLVRTASAPELLKLAQADSAAWHALHAAGSNGTPQTAFLSHQDHWLT